MLILHYFINYFLFLFQSAFLATLGGDTTTTKTNKILKYVLTNQLAKDFNFVGQKNTNKKAFSKFGLKNVIIRK